MKIKVTQWTYNTVKAKLKKGKSTLAIHNMLSLSTATIEAIRTGNVEVVPTKTAKIKEEPSDVFFRF